MIQNLIFRYIHKYCWSRLCLMLNICSTKLALKLICLIKYEHGVICVKKRLKKIATKLCNLILVGSLFAQNILCAYGINDGIEVDATSRAKGVTITNAANNDVPVVNITNPNPAGVSHNTFNNFNVSSHGVIINNSNKIDNSTLGGQVFANPNLQNRNPAILIINEVTSLNPSKINGATEIFGSRASYILANPNGISCNGGEFINTSRVILTTGVPKMNNLGELEKLIVKKGEVVIDGFNINHNNLDYYEIISATARINKEIHANKIKIVTGNNNYNYKTGAITKNGVPKTTKALAIDSSLVGGLYAGKIDIISTDEGVGVNLPPMYEASNINITIDGKITHNNLQSKDTIKVTSHQDSIQAYNKAKTVSSKIHYKAKHNIDIDREALIQADLVTFETQGNIINNGLIKASVNDIKLNAFTLINNGEIFARNALETGLSGDSINNGVIYTTNLIKITTLGELVNSGTIKAIKDINIDSRMGVINNQGASIIADGNLSILSKGDITNNLGGAIIAKGNLLDLQVHKLSNFGDIISAKQMSLTTASDYENHGNIISDELSFKIGGNLINFGTILAHKNISSEVSGFQENFGSIISQYGGGRLKTDGYIKNSGKIEADGKLKLNSSYIENKANALIKSMSVLRINVGSYIENDSIGTIESKDMRLTGALLINKGIIKAKDGFTAEKNFINIINTGQINSDQTITINAIESISNQGGTIITDADLKLIAKVVTNSKKGIIKAKTFFQLEAAENIKNLDDSSLQSLESKLVLKGSGLENEGKIFARKDIEIQEGITNGSKFKIITNKGVIDSDASIVLTVSDSITNYTGKILALETVTISTKDFTNIKHGMIEAHQGVKIIASDNIENNDGSQIKGNNNFILLKGRNVTNDGMIDANHEIKIVASNEIKNSRNGTIKASGSALTIENKINLADAIALNPIDGDVINSGILNSDLKVNGNIINAMNSLILSTNDTLNLSAKNLTNDGTIFSNKGNATFNIAENFTNNRDIYANDGLTLKLDGKVKNLGEVIVMGNLNIKGITEDKVQKITNAGTLDIGGDFIGHAAEQIKNTKNASIVVGRMLDLQALNFNNEGRVEAANVKTKILRDVTNDGDLKVLTGDWHGAVGGNMTNKNKINVGGKIDLGEIKGNFTNEKFVQATSGMAGRILGKLLNKGTIVFGPSSPPSDNNKELSGEKTEVNLEVMGDIINSPEATIYFNGNIASFLAKNFTNDGLVYIDKGDLEANLQGNLINNKKIFAKGNATVKVDGFIDNKLLIIADQKLDIKGLNSKSIQKLTNTGVMQAGDNFTINSQEEVFNLVLSANITSGAKLHITAPQIENKGKIYGDILEAIIAVDINNSGEIGAKLTSINIDGNLNNSGTISTAALIGNIVGILTNIGHIETQGKLVINTKKVFKQEGTLRSEGTIDITTPSFSTSSGALTGAKSNIIIVGDYINNASGSFITVGGNIDLNSPSNSNSNNNENIINKGVINAGGKVSLRSEENMINSGFIYGHDIDSYSSDFTNNAGAKIQAHNNVRFINANDNNNLAKVTNAGLIESLGVGTVSFIRSNFINKGGNVSVNKEVPSEVKKEDYYTYEQGKYTAHPDGWFGEGFRHEQMIHVPKAHNKSIGQPSESLREPNWWKADRTDTYIVARDTASGQSTAGGKVISKGDIEFSLGSITNEHGAIISAARDIKLNGSYLDNNEIQLKELELQVYTYAEKRYHKTDRYDSYPEDGRYQTPSIKIKQIGKISATIAAGCSITGNLAGKISNRGYSNRASVDGIPVLDMGKSKQVISSLVTIDAPDLKVSLSMPSSKFEKMVVNEYDSYLKVTGHLPGEKVPHKNYESRRQVEISKISIPDIKINLETWDTELFASMSQDTPHYKFNPSPAPKHHYRVETDPMKVDPKLYFGTKDFARRILGHDPENAPRMTGENYVHMQLIRDQLIELAGSRLIGNSLDDNEIAHALYESGTREASRLNLRTGISLSGEQIAALREDIVWPEPVMIREKSILVPRVYLAKTTEKRSGIYAANIDLIADSIENTSTLKANKLKLTSRSNITNFGGELTGKQSLNLYALGELSNISGKITGGEAEVIAGSINNITVISRLGDEQNFVEIAHKKAEINISSKAHIVIAGDFVNIGGNVKTGERDVEVGGDIRFLAQTLESRRQASGDDYSVQTGSIRHIISESDSLGSSKLQAGGDIDIIGSSYKVRGDNKVVATGQTTVIPLKDMAYYSSTSKKEGDFWTGDKSSSSSYLAESLVGGQLDVSGRNEIDSKGGTNLIGVKIQAGGGTKLSGGPIRLGSVMVENFSMSQSSARGAAWQSSKGSGYSTSDVYTTEISGGLLFGDVQGGIKVDVDTTTSTSQGKTPAGMWEALAGRDIDVKVNPVQSTRDSWAYKQEGLTPEASFIISLAASVTTGGAAGSLATSTIGVGTTTQAISGAMLKGALIATASQGAVAMVNNRGDVGKAVLDVSRKDGLKSIVLASAIAGGGAVFSALPTPEALSGFAHMGKLMDYAIKPTIIAAVTGDKLEHGLLRGAIGFGTSVAFNTIGDVGIVHDLTDGGVIKIGLHAAVGGMIAEISGGKFASGAIGAGLAEAASPGIDKFERQETREGVASTIGAIGAFAAKGNAQDIGIASTISGSARTHNREAHSDERKVLQKAYEGKTEEEKKRLENAAAYLIKADSVPDSDKDAVKLKTMVEEGKSYKQEQELLLQTAKDLGFSEAFVYSKTDKFIDSIRMQDPMVDKGISAFKVKVGAESAKAFGTIAAQIPPTHPLLIGVKGVAGLAALKSVEYGANGAKELTSPYYSKEGERVLRSFKEEVPSYVEEKESQLAGVTAGYALGKVVGLTGEKLLKTGVGKKAASYWKSVLSDGEPALARGGAQGVSVAQNCKATVQAGIAKETRAANNATKPKLVVVEGVHGSIKQPKIVTNDTKPHLEVVKPVGKTAKEVVVENPYIARAYAKEIQNLTKQGKLNEKQIPILKKALKEQEFVKLSKIEADTHRSKFDKVKNDLRKEWEKNTGQTWPVYKKNYYNEAGKEVKKAGAPYDAHHIIQSNHGGSNEWWNIHPVHFKEEHPKLHNASSRAREIFQNKANK